MSHGFFKVHRQLFDNPIWGGEPFTRGQAWIDLLGKVNYNDGWLFVRGVKVDIKRGETCRSEDSLAKDWQWSRGKVRRFLSLLESEEMITRKQYNRIGIISICNYNRFQDSEYTNDTTDGTTNDTTDGQQTVQQTDDKQYSIKENKKNKKNKNKEKENSAFSEDSNEMILSKCLFRHLSQRDQKAKEPNWQAWCKDADLLMRVDGRPFEEVKSVIDWCQNHHFWRTQIRSISKLRVKFEVLLDQKTSESFQRAPYQREINPMPIELRN